jgi:hypothetical protein
VTDLIRLTQDLIAMRKYPLKHDGVARYPAASQAFTAAVAACDDPAILRDILRLDTGHVLPTVAKQQVYEKLLINDANRTPALLQAFAMHLEMFGYVDENGMRQEDTVERIEALLAEADAKRG